MDDGVTESPDRSVSHAAPRVSVVLPVHNAHAFLPEALASIFALDWPALELIAVDDGSTDGSDAILRAAVPDWSAAGRRMEVLTQPNRGAAAARNAGIARARGDYVLLADADDRCDPGLVAAGVAALEADPSADLAVAPCRYIDATGAVVGVQDALPARIGTLALLNGVMVNTPLVRRDAGAAIGWHDTDLDGSVDLDLFVRLTLNRPDCLVSMPGPLSDYRRTTGQITSDWRRMRRTWERVRDKALAAGFAPGPAALSRMRGQHCAYWATLAYMAGEYRAARRLMAEGAWRAPGHVLRDDFARIRAAACLVSLLPAGLHDRIRDRFNTRHGTLP